jgi:hypothetical protein
LSLTLHLTNNKGATAEEKAKVTPPPKPGEELLWTPARYTQAKPTDAYGTIEFQGGPHPSKAQVSSRLPFSLPFVFCWVNRKIERAEYHIGECMRASPHCFAI